MSFRSILSLATAGSAVALTLAFTPAAQAAVSPVATGPAAQAAISPVTTDPAGGAAGWLARQLVDGTHQISVFGGTAYPDQGLTADSILAFDSAGVAQTAAVSATTWLAANIGSYVSDGVPADATTEQYAGALAKSALIAQAQGLDPNSFGGWALLSTLKSLETTAGRFSDKSAFGDYSNALTQSLAVIALVRAGGTGPDSAAVDSLASLQCSDGGFELEYAATGATCTSDPDATAFAAQALLAAGRTAAADTALDYLTVIQGTDGSFGGVTGVNTNTTGLAGEALAIGGRTATAAKGRAYLISRQQTVAGETPDSLGAIAYEPTGYNPNTSVRATAQAVLGLDDVGLLTVTSTGATGPAPTLQPTSTVVTSTTSSAPTSSSTASSSSASSSTTESNSTGSSTPSSTPTAATSVSRSTSSGIRSSSTSVTSTPRTPTSSITIAVLGTGRTTTTAGTLTVSPSTVEVGGTVLVSVAGLAPGATGVIQLHAGPVTLATFLVNANGTVSATVTIPANTAPGTHTLSLVSSAGITLASVTITVTGPTLPNTGFPATGIMVGGLLVLLLGAALTLIGRRRQPTHR